MKNSKMKMLTLSLAMVVGTTVFAQKQTDLSLAVSVTPAEVDYGDSFEVKVVITNDGPEALTSMDTFGYKFKLTPDTSTNIIPVLGPIAVNDSKDFSIKIPHNIELSKDIEMTLCYYLVPQKNIKVNGHPLTVTFTDMDSTNDLSCAKVTLKNKAITSIADQALMSVAPLELYPNPSSGSISFKVLAPENESITASIIDMSGKELMSKNFGKAMSTQVLNMDVSALPAGIFVHQVTAGNKKYFSKLIIKK